MGPYAALFEVGAVAHNLTESQFGLASIAPRWNLSGTYQQVVPRYFSTNADGGDEQEFLNGWFDSMAKLATNIFLKGYQWPFDHDKVADFGSSVIDILVQNEMINRGRRVFMDFRENSRATDGLEEFSLENLGQEAMAYLRKSGAIQATPIERLAHMNRPSIDLYAEMGVDLWKQPLEIGVCAQHCNGGFAVDVWWESTLPHLFVVGELAGTHGVKRPGGSALNSGQVGSMRAAQRIAHIYYEHETSTETFAKLAEPTVGRFVGEIARIKAADQEAMDCEAVRREIQHCMSASAGMVRGTSGVARTLAEAKQQWLAILRRGLTSQARQFMSAMEVRELALAQLGFLEAIAALLARGSGSRGSHLVTDPAGALPHPRLGKEWKYIPENPVLRNEILTIRYCMQTDSFAIECTTPRTTTESDDWFENTWAEYRGADVFRKTPAEKPRPYKIYR